MPLPPRVLLVEDDEVSGTALSAFLTGSGYATTWARTVAAGVAALDARPDVLVLDLMLPDGQGWEVLVRARALGLDPRAIVVTGADGQVLEQVVAHRPHVVLRKPVDADALLRWVGR